jgi:hypothetical protein
MKYIIPTNSKKLSAGSALEYFNLSTLGTIEKGARQIENGELILAQRSTVP